MKKIKKSKTYGFYSPMIKKFKIKNLKSLSQPAFKRSLKDFNKLSRKNLIELNMYYIGIIYNLLKSKLPQLKTIKQKALPKRKTKKKTGVIYTAKNGTKYKILASGKARFIKS